MILPSPLSPFRVTAAISPFQSHHGWLNALSQSFLSSEPPPQSLLSIPPWMSPLSLSLSRPQFSLLDSHQSLTVTFPVCLLSLTMDVPSQRPPFSHSPSQFPCSVSPQSPLNFPPIALRAATHEGKCPIGADPLSGTSIKPSLTLQTLSALSRQTFPAQIRSRRLELPYFHGFPYWFPT